jgi:adenine deaminase
MMTMQTLPDVALAEKIAVGAGTQIADLVFKGGQIFNVFTGSWEKADLAISGTTIAGIGTGYRGIQEYDVSGCYLTPGFLDAHVHIESSMLAPRELAKVLLLNGVTGIFADPHEIANVLGLDGLNFMLQETADIPSERLFSGAQLRTGHGSGNQRRYLNGGRAANFAAASAGGRAGRDDELSRRTSA